MTGKQKKKDQLGCDPGTAQYRLTRLILFDLICKLELNYCYQCKSIISSVEDLSIEHKVPWLDSNDPKELFYDIDNIAFSHKSCNYGAARKYSKKWKTDEQRKKLRAENERKRWSKLDKKDQQRIRREKYLKYGK